MIPRQGQKDRVVRDKMGNNLPKIILNIFLILMGVLISLMGAAAIFSDYLTAAGFALIAFGVLNFTKVKPWIKVVVIVLALIAGWILAGLSGLSMCGEFGASCI